MIRFECGCIALDERVDEDGKHMLIHFCDSDPRDGNEYYAFGRRDMRDKSFRPMSGKEEVEAWMDIGQLVAEGYKLREVKSVLQSLVAPHERRKR